MGADTNWMQPFGDLEVDGTVEIDAGAMAKFDNITVDGASGNATQVAGLVVVRQAELEANDRIMVDGLMFLEEGTVNATNEVLVRDGGRLDGTGMVDSPQAHAEPGGYIAPDLSPGELVITGDVQLDAGAVLEIEIAGLTAGDEYDVISAAGDVTIEGNIVLTFIDGFAPQPGDTVEFLTSDGATDLANSTYEI